MAELYLTELEGYILGFLSFSSLNTCKMEVNCMDKIIYNFRMVLTNIQH